MSLSSKNNPEGMSNSELLLFFPMCRRFLRHTYELGLLSLSFTPAAKDTPLVRKSRSSAAPLFPSANVQSTQHIKFKKETTDLLSFFSAFSRVVQPHGIKPIAATIPSPPNKDLFIEIQNQTEDLNTYILLPLGLANLFKLPQRQIWHGRLLANGFCSQAEFNEIEMNKEFDIQIVTPSSAGNRIICEEQIDSMFFIRAPSTESHAGFFSKISDKFFQLGYSVAFDFNDKENCRVSVFGLTRVKDEFIVIPQEIADALGLQSTHLSSGVHESLQPFQMDKFKLIKEGDRLWFTYVRLYTTVYPMMEPTKDYQSMIRAINVALNENYLPYMRIKFAYEGDDLVLTDGPDTIRVELPKAVNEFYNFLSPGTFFHKGTRQRLPKSIRDEIAEATIEREEQGVNPQHELVDGEPPHHVVQCNVIDNGIVGGHDFPTIRVLHNTLDHDKGQISWAGEPVIYLPLDREHLYYIKLRLISEKGSLLNLDPKSETTANLVFRQRV